MLDITSGKPFLSIAFNFVADKAKTTFQELIIWKKILHSFHGNNERRYYFNTIKAFTHTGTPKKNLAPISSMPSELTKIFH